jgi:hypothetical protein
MRLRQIIRNLLQPRLLIHPKPSTLHSLLSLDPQPLIPTLLVSDPLLELFDETAVAFGIAEVGAEAVSEIVEDGEGEGWVEDLEEVGFDGGGGSGGAEGGDDGEVAGCEESYGGVSVWREKGGVVEVSLRM